MSTIVVRPSVNWTTEENVKVAVFEKRDGLKFSVQEGQRVTEGSIPLKLYEKEYALQLIHLFQKVFLSDSQPPCFLPFFVRDALIKREGQLCSAPHLQVALFGQVGYTQNEKKVIQSQWGVFDKQKHTINWVQVDDQSGCAKEFMLNAPLYDKPNKVKERHFEMSSYLKHFRVVVIPNSDNKIQHVALSWASMIDRNMLLSHDSWAVTLLSAPKSEGVGAVMGTGHAMIACEGVKANRTFLTYIHITRKPRVTTNSKGDPLRELKANEAQVEPFDKHYPLSKALNGPTWSRSSVFVNRILSHAIAATDKPILFVNFSAFAPLKHLFKSLTSTTFDRLEGISVENCLSYSIFLLEKASIFLPVAERPEPNKYIKTLFSDYMISDTTSDKEANLFILPNDPNKQLQARFNYVIRTGAAFITQTNS